ncbi:MAG: DUF1549 and DUF1553 domain-containing protein [Planctomycetota bacterium]
MLHSTLWVLALFGALNGTLLAQGTSRDHWAWHAPRRSPAPKLRNDAWCRSDLDRFVLASLETRGLQPQDDADRATLIRRVTLDLTGLSPTLPEIDAFVNDKAPNAYRRLVDRLLSSPRYGEHMAVAWLDAARYADTNGYNNDTPRYNWRYRDWVISAFHRNLPYDHFIIEQLAGDLLPKPSVDQLVATGFNRNHNVTSEGGIVDEEYRLEYVADRVHTTSTVFLALTLRCARCHDHKFDPISQREYYEFFSFFNQVPEKGYHKEHIGNVKPVISAPTPRQRLALAAIDRDIANVDTKLKAAPNDAKLSEALKTLKARKASLQKQVPTAMVMRDLPKPRDTFLLKRGAYDAREDKVAASVPSVFPPLPQDAPKNRLGVAKWLVRRDHPLTARVAVNRLWYQIFGRGLVDTPEDFGTQGRPPSHPKLLDWLALELVDSGWNLQHVVRVLVESSTYRQSSFATKESLRVDPENRNYGRGPRFRMSAEMIRDNALQIGGLLTDRVGGPSVRPYQPAGLWVEVAVGDDNYSGGPYRQSHGADLYRRSVYTWWKRTCPPPNLRAFDAPEREFCRVQRSRTATPLQSLVLLNDPTFVEAARSFAERIIHYAPSADKRIEFAFRVATSRRPSAQEIEILRETAKQYEERFRKDLKAARKLISVGESKADPSIDVRELAAWSTIAAILLNLDETITKG